MMAISSISSLDETVTVQAEHLRLVFQRVLEMETTFWEQSESITNHIKHLEIPQDAPLTRPSSEPSNAASR
jgi:hypothetical protein